jgi:endo-1,4-beta-xylanase
MIKVPLAAATFFVWAGPVSGVVAQDCALPGAACTLAETARQVGVFVGAAIASPELPAEQATIPREFNSITAENAMKWGELAPTVGSYDFGDADAIAGFAASMGVRLRGHALLWGRMQLPGDLEDTVEEATDPAAKLRKLIDEHLSTVVPRYRDVVAVWDVVNEPLSQFTADLDPNVFARTLGEAYIDEAFHRAHELDPDAQLFLNEFFDFYGLETPFRQKAQGFLDLVERLLDRGVPVHGVGVQAHFNGFVPGLIPLPTRAEFEGFLRSLADLGVAVELTELDVSINYFQGDPDPLARQAEFYGEVVAACMAVPSCRAVTTWGITDSRTWLDRFPPFSILAPHEPLLFDASLEPKPAYSAVRDAVAAREGPFHERAARLISFLDDAHAAGDLGGDRWALRWIRRTLVRTGFMLQRESFRAACNNLELVDWLLAPSHRSRHRWLFVQGPAAAHLADGARTLRESLDCADRHSGGGPRASVLEFRERLEVVGSQDLPLHDGEVDLDRYGSWLMTWSTSRSNGAIPVFGSQRPRILARRTSQAAR